MKAGSRAPAPLPSPGGRRHGLPRREKRWRGSLPLLQRTDVAFWKKAGCISCHNNTLTAETIAAARLRGVSFRQATSPGVNARTVAGFLESWRERALQGIGIPGDADTISYILLGLAAEGHPA